MANNNNRLTGPKQNAVAPYNAASKATAEEIPFVERTAEAARLEGPNDKNSAQSSPKAETPAEPRSVSSILRMERIKHWVARILTYGVLPAVIGATAQAVIPDRVKSEPGVDPQTGMTSDYAARIKEQYEGKYSAEESNKAVARLQAQKEKQAEADKKAGLPTTRPDPAQAQQQALNKGFAEANARVGGTGLPDGVIVGIAAALSLGGIGLTKRAKSGGGPRHVFSGHAQGLSGFLYGNSPKEILYNRQRDHFGAPPSATVNYLKDLVPDAKAAKASGNGESFHAQRMAWAAEDSAHAHEAVLGQQIPPRAFPWATGMTHGIKVSTRPLTGDEKIQLKIDGLDEDQIKDYPMLQASPGSTRAEIHKGSFPNPNARPAKPGSGF